MEPPATPRKPKSSDSSENEESKKAEPKTSTRKSTSAAADSAKPKSTTAKKPAAKATKAPTTPTAPTTSASSAAADAPAMPKGTATPPPPASRPPTPAPKPATPSAAPTRAESDPDIFKPMPSGGSKSSGAPMPQRPIIPDNVREGITQGAARLSRTAQDGIVQVRKALRENSGPLAKSAQGAGNQLLDLLRKLILGIIDVSRRATNWLSSPLATLRDQLGKAVTRLEESVRKDDTAVIVTTLLTIAACVILSVAVIAVTRGR